MKKKMPMPIPNSLPRTSSVAMAPKEALPERSDEDKMREGSYDLDHLLKAEDIKQDSDRMGYVMKAHQKRMTGMRSIQDLRDAGQALAAQTRASAMPQQPSDNDGDEPLPKPRVKQRYPKGQ